MNFADRLINAIKEKQNPTVLGLDTDFINIPEYLKEDYKLKYGKTFVAVEKCIIDFNKQIIDATKDIVPAVKIQIAFYEQYGVHGMLAFEKTVEYAKQNGLLVIVDAKRNDIGNTAKAYSNAFLGRVDLFGEKVPSPAELDCTTVNGYLGSDGIFPFIKDCNDYGKGIFVLVKTSNPSSGELQDLETDPKRVYEVMAEHVNNWGKDVVGQKGYSSVGAVVGATYPKEAEILRTLMPISIFLVPGYGAQGGGAKDVIPCFNKDGMGAIVNNSRGIIFAYKNTQKSEREFANDARDAAIAMKEDLTAALQEAKICAWK